MKEHILMLSESTSLLCLIAFFTLLFVIILKSLRYTSFFGRKTSVVLSLCVSLLCIIGLSQLFVTDKVSKVSEISRNYVPDFNLILLPYEALAVVILLSPFMWIIVKIFYCDKQRPKRLHRKPEKNLPFRDVYKPIIKRDEDRFTK